MVASFHLQTLQGLILHKPDVLGLSSFTNSTLKSNFTSQKLPFQNIPKAKFNLYEIMGGRGICNGEEGLQQELKKSVSKEGAPTVPTSSSEEAEEEEPEVSNISEDAFEKELFGLTGGFPGGEKGLKKFIDQNPLPNNKEPQTV